MNRSHAPLRGVPEIRRFFRTSETPVYFVSATAFNLLGIDRWVRGFRLVNYFDSFDGHHPHVFVPEEREPRAFTSIEEIVNYLLGHKEVIDWVRGRGPGTKKVVHEDLKVMKRIDPRETAIEGVVTRHGTLVGPLMTELAGFPELTPYTGGWCGNDVFADVLSEQHRTQARAYTQAMGERLRQEGYLGYFEIDFLADVDSGQIYLGELNPRVTGASSITNVTAMSYGDMPLFLFHLLEYMDVDCEIDVDELNERWTHPQNIDECAQFVLKQSEDTVERITAAPPSGRWRMDGSDAIGFVRPDTDWHTVTNDREAFYLRIAGEGQYRYKGADLGILVTRGRLMDDGYELTDRARAWIGGIKAAFAGVPVDQDAGRDQPPLPENEPFGFKML